MRDIVDAIWGREFVVGLVFGVGALILAMAGGGPPSTYPHPCQLATTSFQPPIQPIPPS
ncbi:MAG TPA: hypothetical protein VMM14_03825 [Acidimicrobiia bacterium]|nr:hypothetical protein [Acidimicrobiia bacterium]